MMQRNRFSFLAKSSLRPLPVCLLVRQSAADELPARLRAGAFMMFGTQLGSCVSRLSQVRRER